MADGGAERQKKLTLVDLERKQNEQQAAFEEAIKKVQPTPTKRFGSFLSALGGLAGLTTAIFFVAVYKGKVDTLVEQSQSLNIKIQRETDLRRIFWSDQFVYKKDTSHSKFKVLLEYDIPKDTLTYPSK